MSYRVKKKNFFPSELQSRASNPKLRSKTAWTTAIHIVSTSRINCYEYQPKTEKEEGNLPLTAFHLSTI
jgi:hypothetical protein